MGKLQQTALHDRHVAAGAKMVEFAGWEMPVQYKGGIVAEHLATRAGAGLFDVSHMGRFTFAGPDALALLQHVLTNNAAALEPGQAQYTMIPNQTGGAIDDAYLYRFDEAEYLLVVNAANRQKDLKHLKAEAKSFDQVSLDDRTSEIAMVSLQGPQAKRILGEVIEAGELPEPARNRLGDLIIAGVPVRVGRTGYTGEPLCFELFIPSESAAAIWDLLVARGAEPVGLGARDTLRLEAGLPLYGHELGEDPAGSEIPIFACPLARFAVSFSEAKGSYVGRDALARQHEAWRKSRSDDYSAIEDLPQIIRPIAVTGKGVARAGAKVFGGQEHVGYVTSGTMVPYWQFADEGLRSRRTDEHGMRAIGLALVDSRLKAEDEVEIEIRGRRVDAVIVAYHLRPEAPPYARPILHEKAIAEKPAAQAAQDITNRIADLLTKAAENTEWRQRRCINLIPSEMTHSPMARLLSVMDPSFRYAEHKELPAFYDSEIFYYQGTDFIERVELLLQQQFRQFLGCREVETRIVSGQMANTAVFSAIVDYLNRGQIGTERRRIGRVMNNHIIRGGHLSAQPMGALKDFVAHDPQTERPAVTSFPVCRDDPYRIDIDSAGKLIDRYRPELIIFGKSMVLYAEPITQIRKILDKICCPAVIMYDAAHVLGLLGPHFQQPFAEGAEIVTGSTHKTFFGTQRGLIAADYDTHDERHDLWKAIGRRTFPGSVSNHHLGTMLGLLMAAYEMNHFKDDYQQAVIANAKAFAAALARSGLDVAGDPEIGYTQTHQVVVHVGYGRGPQIAARLEQSNIIVNYQASPREEGFTAAGALRMGVAEMTRFGFGPAQFEALAELIADVVIRGSSAAAEAEALRGDFRQLQYCFGGDEFAEHIQRLHTLI